MKKQQYHTNHSPQYQQQKMTSPVKSNQLKKLYLYTRNVMKQTKKLNCCKRSKFFFFEKQINVSLFLFINECLPTKVTSILMKWLSMKALPFLQNTYKGRIQNYQRSDGGLNLSSFDSCINALFTWRIHNPYKKTFCLRLLFCKIVTY